MSYKPKPHVAPALAHLQYGVTGAAVVLALCAAIQLLVFGFVHFTQVRFEEPPHRAVPITVVTPGRPVAPPLPSAGTGSLATGAALAASNGQTPAPIGHAPAPTPRALGRWDASLHTLADMNASAAVMAGLLLCAFAILGVVVAGASAVPGVQKAVSGAMWSMLIAMTCLPWHDLVPSMMFKGAFGDYATMAQMSTAVDAGKASAIPLFAAYLLAPLAALCGSLLVLWRFRQGVAEGVIATSMSELDERLEREMAGIRIGGVAGQPTTRAVAALNHAIGETPEDEAAPANGHPALAGAGNGGLRKVRSAPLSKLGRGWSAPDDDRRPI